MAEAFWTYVWIDIPTTISSIIVTCSNVGFIITESITNQRILIHIFRKIVVTNAFWAIVWDNTRSTTVPAIVPTDFNVCFIITETISNQRMKSSIAALLKITITFRTVLFVNIVYTAVSSIIVADGGVGFIIAYTISNQKNIVTTKKKFFWFFRNYGNKNFCIGCFNMYFKVLNIV